MNFCSPIFLFLFFPTVVVVYWSLPRPLRNAVLLAGSLIFYIWGEGTFVLVMLASIVWNWLFGLALESFAGRRARHAVVTAAAALNLSLLAFYKYSGFLLTNLNALLSVADIGPFEVVAPHLPLGISFFTFHSLSYIIDVYRRDAVAQKNPVRFALYISFFPQLIAGPIIRYHDIYRQLGARTVTLDLAASGIERFLAGFGKKMLLANPLGEVTDRIFALPVDQLDAATAWLGIACYTLQIYLDFSAYSDMAIGLARTFGFTFLENFNYPYVAQSFQEFWRRWHISLSNWFRDYLYFPLGGSHASTARTYFNLVVVFLLCGLWHGANWTFVVWGMLHGSFLILERAGFSNVLRRLPRALRHLYVLTLVMIAWVFFRSADLAQALHYLQAMAGFGASAAQFDAARFVDPYTVVSLVIGALASTSVFSQLTADWRCRKGQVAGKLKLPIETLSIDADGVAALGLRFASLVMIGLVAASRVAAGTYNPFIYFRF